MHPPLVMILASPLVMILASALYFGTQPVPEDAVKKELKKLEGAWSVVGLEFQGQKMPEEQIKQEKMRYVFQGEKCTVKNGERTVAESNIKIDPEKQPKTLDITAAEGERKGEVFLGIYELTDDTLKMSYIPGGKSRPKQIGDKGALILTMKREKP